VKWLDGKVFASIPKVKGSNLMGGVVCGQQWYIDQIFSYRIFKIGAKVDYVALIISIKNHEIINNIIY
jgi:hypothetical protein